MELIQEVLEEVRALKRSLTVIEENIPLLKTVVEEEEIKAAVLIKDKRLKESASRLWEKPNKKKNSKQG